MSSFTKVIDLGTETVNISDKNNGVTNNSSNIENIKYNVDMR